MPPRKGRNYRRSLPPDFLSNLPNNIIDVILLRLPFKEAVRTSILSTKWRYNWCRLTELTLDKTAWDTQKDLQNPTDRFTRIIYQLLTLHGGQISKFTLDIAFLKRCPEIDNLIYFLSRNGIQHLVLRLPWDRYILPTTLFTCSQLKHLSLHSCFIRPPSAFKGFNRLISLKLSKVVISSEVLQHFLSNCPLLERLLLEAIEVTETSYTVEINVPMLRSFDYKGKLSSICLKNVPVLANVSVVGAYFPKQLKTCDFTKFFESCSALEHLKLDFFDTEFITEEADEAATRLPFELKCVKRFHLDGLLLDESYVACPLRLIGSFPYLEFLEIKAYNVLDEDKRIVDSLGLERFSDVTFNHLREVEIGCFSGTSPQMQLTKFFLAKSPVLVRLVIDDEPLTARSKILADLSKVQCASPSAEVVYQRKEKC